MHVAQSVRRFWENDMHMNKDLKYVACSKLHTTYFRVGFEA